MRISSDAVTSVGAVTAENVAGTTTLTVDSDMSFSGGELAIGKG